MILRIVKRDVGFVGQHWGNSYYTIRKLKRGGYSVNVRYRYFKGFGGNEGTKRFSTWREVLEFLEGEGIALRDLLGVFSRLPAEEREVWKEEIELTKTFHVPRRKLPELHQTTLAGVVS